MNKTVTLKAVGWLRDHPGEWSAEDVAEGIGMPASARFVFTVLTDAERIGLVESRTRHQGARLWQAARGTPELEGRELTRNGGTG